MFESSVIVAYESLSFPRCEKMDLKTTQSLLERVQIHKNAGKPNNLWDLTDLSEEQQEVYLFRTNKGLMNNYHKNNRCGLFR